LARRQNHHQIYREAIPADYQYRRFSRLARGEDKVVVRNGSEITGSYFGIIRAVVCPPGVQAAATG
jgi:hypothetical protein